LVKLLELILLVKDELKKADREVFLAISLNTRNKILGINTVSVGSLNASLVHPREVFKDAIMHGAYSVVLAHNHPSGDSEPSEDDLMITKRLVEAGKILDIKVTDHIIITKNGYFGFKEKNLI
jgi:DNA repair protein RadC